MAKNDYKIHEDGFAELWNCEEIKKYFFDNDVIGKFVESADLYMIRHYGRYSFDFLRKGVTQTDTRYRDLNLKMCFHTYFPAYFICEFTDGTYFTVDYCFEGRIFMKYGSEHPFSDEEIRELDIKYISPELYGSVFKNLKGERFNGICMPVDYCISKYESVGVFSSIEPVYLEFSNSSWSYSNNLTYYTDDKTAHSDAVGFNNEFNQPYIAYYTDRDIPFFEPESEKYRSYFW